jgi:hypothetical protein
MKSRRVILRSMPSARSFGVIVMQHAPVTCAGILPQATRGAKEKPGTVSGARLCFDDDYFD